VPGYVPALQRLIARSTVRLTDWLSRRRLDQLRPVTKAFLLSMADVSTVEPVEVDVLAIAQADGTDWLPIRLESTDSG
jgi:hypothetical protein